MWTILICMTKIYTLTDPITNQVRYVGKTIRPLSDRRNKHVQDAKRTLNHRACWIRGLLSKGVKPIIELLEEVPNSEWQECERFYISYFRFLGFRLTNILDGGNCDVPTRYISKKLSVAGTGRKHTPEAKRKISMANSGPNNGMYGAIISVRERAKRRRFHTGKKMSLAAIEKTRIANLGRKNTMEAREKMRASSPNKRPVYQYDLCGTLIKCWDSVAECCRTMHYCGKNIAECCNHKRLKTYRGFRWEYKEL